MNPGFSLYLDAVRFAAAVLMVLYHTNLRWLISEPFLRSLRALGGRCLFRFVRIRNLVCFIDKGD